jgi:hypothetical protein
MKHQHIVLTLSLFFCLWAGAQSSNNKTRKPVVLHSSLSVGLNKSIWNNGNHRGWHSQIQYKQDVSRWISFSFTGSYGKGLVRDAFVSIRPIQGTITRYDSRGWAASIEPALGISAFKNKIHELTLFGGLTGGVYQREEYRGYYDETVFPYVYKVRQVNKPQISGGLSFRLMYMVRIKQRIQVGVNMANLTFENGAAPTYYGLQIGFLLNKPVIPHKKLEFLNIIK